MADTIQSLSDLIAVTQREVSDLNIQLSSLDARVSVNETEINTLLNPPASVPSGMISWFNLGHTIKEVDTILSSDITGINTTLSSHTTSIANLVSDLATEVTNRTNADTTLQANIDSVQSQVTTNLTTLTQEISDRATLASTVASQYDLLNSRLDDLSSSLSLESTTSLTATNSLSSQVSTINQALQTAQTQITLLQGIGVDPLGAQASQITTLTTIANDATTAIATETANRQSADLALQNTLNSVSSSISGISAGLLAETNARIAAISPINSQLGTITTNVSANTAAIAAETAARIAADSTLSTTVSGHTTQISDNTSAIATEVTNRTTADTGLQTQITTNTGNITANTANIATNTTAITGLKAHFGIVKDGSGYVTSYRINDDSLAASNFNLRNLNNDLRLQNPGYIGKYFLPVSTAAFSPAVSYSTLYGGVTTNDFHGTDGSDYTRNVLVYATATIGAGVFTGVDYSTGGNASRLGQVLTTFKVDISGGVNRYLSLWYRIKNTPTDTTQRWFPVVLADNTMSGQRTYEQTRAQAVVNISVTSDKVIEFGLTTLNTLNASIADATKDFIYGGSVSIVALNMVTIA